MPVLGLCAHAHSLTYGFLESVVSADRSADFSTTPKGVKSVDVDRIPSLRDDASVLDTTDRDDPHHPHHPHTYPKHTRISRLCTSVSQCKGTGFLLPRPTAFPHICGHIAHLVRTPPVSVIVHEYGRYARLIHSRESARVQAFHLCALDYPIW